MVLPTSAVWRPKVDFGDFCQIIGVILISAAICGGLCEFREIKKILFLEVWFGVRLIDTDDFLEGKHDEVADLIDLVGRNLSKDKKWIRLQIQASLFNSASCANS